MKNSKPPYVAFTPDDKDHPFKNLDAFRRELMKNYERYCAMKFKFPTQAFVVTRHKRKIQDALILIEEVRATLTE